MKTVEVLVVEAKGFDRINEPVSISIPFEKGSCFIWNNFILVDRDGVEIPHQTTCLASWSDSSMKWVLFQFAVDMEAISTKKIRINLLNNEQKSKKSICFESPLSYHRENDEIIVQTGDYTFRFQANGFFSIKEICASNVQVLEKESECRMTDEESMLWRPWVDSIECERFNQASGIFFLKGHFRAVNKIHALRFKSRLHFYAGLGTIRIDFTVWNPQAAEHKGGAWDLGDTGSILFQSLQIYFPLASQKNEGYYTLQPASSIKPFQQSICIYQESSGGGSWDSKNHINRYGQIPLIFKGYQVMKNGNMVDKGDRSTPVICIRNDHWHVGLTMPYFWENCPKALSYEDNKLSAHLFPEQFNDLFEIQGGEQKTHTVILDITQNDNAINHLYRAHNPVEVYLDPQVYECGGFSPRLVPFHLVKHDELSKRYQDYVSTAIHGERSFFKRRELIDEYGWRHFGDLFADHEAVFSTGSDHFISHYNNQYDAIKGAIFQFMRTGEMNWWRLAKEMGMHVSDIDIYRTEQDRYQYNYGLFWHTDHHLEAETSTHRTFSKNHLKYKRKQFFGGGPSIHHVYSTGLCYLYWMTGEIRYKESALRLVQYIENAIMGPNTILEFGLNTIRDIKKKIKGIPDTQVYSFDGPGRGAGNALNTMIDGYLLTLDLKYLKLAEKLIRKCISPNDDIDSRKLLNAEFRWMYTIFLQSLGRYLDIAQDLVELDVVFTYAKESFIKYTEWMLDNEFPYLEKPQILEFPNETWCAQDLRKADIFAVASNYCNDEKLRNKYNQKSQYFFSKTFEYLRQFGDAQFLTRPVVVVMTNGFSSMGLSNMNNSDENFLIQENNLIRTKKESYQLVENLSDFMRILKKTSLIKEFYFLISRIR